MSKVRDTSESFLHRQKRFLIFQEGVNWVQMVVGIGFPVALRDETVTLGATVKSYYLLPTNSNDITRPVLSLIPNDATIPIEERSIFPSRWEIYSAIRNFMDKFNLGNGKTCLLRAICEAALVPFEQKSGLLTEVVQIILTPSTTKEQMKQYSDVEYHAAEKYGREQHDCERIFTGCNTYIFKEFTRLFM
ncbi:hypothetical protein RN001_004719 [Aquatica leii]|uniref:Uncharacterized protein n=1 Tax=Aquatica leii TaxID=1421715 RepID=A0AAN7SRU7_9COLE|nr:hypothetical protein RN001_004719 [Aquatica leii]